MTLRLQTIESMPKALAADLKRIGDSENLADLRRQLVSALSITVEQIIRLAAIVRRLEELGDDLSDIEISLLPAIRKVAYGQILPELLVRLQGNGQLLRKACGLPIPEQRRIANGDPVRVIEPGGDHRLIAPLKLTKMEIIQVFAVDHIRDDGEQASWLREHQQQRQKTDTQKDMEVLIDRKANGVRVGEVFISASDLAHYLSQLVGNAKVRRRPAGLP